MTEQNAPRDDEINLAELAASLVANWRTIVTAGLTVACLAAGYAKLFVTPTYEAKSIFAIKKSAGGLADMGAAAAALGLNIGVEKEDKLVFDRVKGRDFVIGLAQTAGLYDDPSFNPRLSPAEPSFIGWLFGTETKTGWSDSEVDLAIVRKFEKSVELGSTKNDSLVATVSHVNPEAAAKIANAVVKKVINDTVEEQKSKAEREVSYLGEQLEKVQADMDAAVMRLQEFSISKNPLSVEDIVRLSSQLGQLRETRASTSRMLEGVSALILATSNSEKQAAVLSTYPELLSSEFHLQAKMSDTEMKAADLPLERLQQITQGLAIRLTDLDATISAAEANAKISAAEASALITLQRDVKVQETTYERLIEQYKARSVASGFQATNGLILQVAVPPLDRAAPKTFLIAVAGAFVGVVFGIVVAMSRSAMSGCLHTVRAIIAAIRPKKVYFVKKSATAADVAAHTLDSSKYAVLWPVSPMAGSLADTVSNHLVTAWSDAGLRAAVIDLPSGRMTLTDQTLAATTSNLGELASLLLKGNALESIEAKTAPLDRVLFKCDYDKVPSAFLSIMTALPTSMIAMARLGDARKSATEAIREVAHPDVLLLG